MLAHPSTLHADHLSNVYPLQGTVLNFVIAKMKNQLHSVTGSKEGPKLAYINSEVTKYFSKAFKIIAYSEK